MEKIQKASQLAAVAEHCLIEIVRDLELSSFEQEGRVLEWKDGLACLQL